MPEVSFEEIGKEIGVSPERARQIFESGIAKIRQYLKNHPEKSKELFMFFDGRQPSLQYPKIPEAETTLLD